MKAIADRHTHCVRSLPLAGLLTVVLSAAALGQTDVANQTKAPSGGPVLSLPQEIEEVLIQNAKALTPLSVLWATTYQPARSVRESIRIGKFVEGRDFFEPREVDFKLQDGTFRYFRKTWRHMEGERRETTFYNTFDGQDLYFGTGPSDQPNGVIVDSPEKRRSAPGTVVFQAEYFERAGFKLHDLKGTLEQPPESLIHYLLGRKLGLSGVGRVDLGGESLTSVEITSKRKNRRHRFLLDPALGYAVRRYEVYTLAGDPVQITVNSEFVELPVPSFWLPQNAESRLWLPQRSQTDWYSWATIEETVLNDPLVHEQIEVKAFSREKMASDTFSMSIERPQMMVADSRLDGPGKGKDGRVQYVVPVNLEHLEGVVEAAAEGKSFSPPPPGTNWTRLALIAGNFAILLGAAAWIWYRRQ